MARRIKISGYRRADGTKVAGHVRRPKRERGAISQMKKLRAHFKGRQRHAERHGSPFQIKGYRKQVRSLSRDIGSVKREGSYRYKRMKKHRRR